MGRDRLFRDGIEPSFRDEYNPYTSISGAFQRSLGSPSMPPSTRLATAS